MTLTMQNMDKSSIAAFNKDVLSNKGYLYTTNDRLSSKIANRRLTDVVLECVDLKNRRVLDIGCGDGTYTFELLDRAAPLSMTGVDAAAEAVALATNKRGGRNLDFITCGADKLPFAPDSFDIAHMRGLLHHLGNPIEVLREALRVAPEIIIVEPNGYNPVLKLIERFSSYHVAHLEKSYAPSTLHGWIKSMGAGISVRRYAGLVPFFCPEVLAKTLKLIEPLVEITPLARSLACAVHVIVAKRN
ncbi:MAG: hypothetical protein A2285_04220 [Elusimicrobia bacterium RIFOXYA12_FULL_57_11]|nr:MAG: hypothetical protein A2285_04220 [Elusimicrobia bacterium RIFOXYA12_FULL_57_11]